MIRVTYCIKRKPGLDRDAFHAYWRDQHAPLVKEHAAALGIRKYVQSYTMSDAAGFPLAQIRGSLGADYDGVAQLWWESREAFAAAGATEAGRTAGAILLDDERKFIDLESSPIFLSEDNPILG